MATVADEYFSMHGIDLKEADGISVYVVAGDDCDGWFFFILEVYKEDLTVLSTNYALVVVLIHAHSDNG